MKRVVGLGLLFGLIACSGDVDSMNGGDGGTTSGDAPGGAGEPANLAGITMMHNQVRAAVQTSTPLPPLQWHPDLAAHAAAWAAMCTDGGDSVNGLIVHNPYRTSVAGFSIIGENIFGAGFMATAKDAVDTWAAEKANFTYPNTCSGICGHYTQIVWRTTTHLGCALASCPNLQFKSAVICDYG